MTYDMFHLLKLYCERFPEQAADIPSMDSARLRQLAPELEQDVARNPQSRSNMEVA